MSSVRLPNSSRETQILHGLIVVLYVVVSTIGLFTSGIWAGLGIGGALIAFALCCHANRQLPKPDTILFGFALMALLIMAGMNLISSDPHESWKIWINLATIFIPLALLSSRQLVVSAFYPGFFPVTAAAALLGAMALGLELFYGTPLLRLFKGPMAAPTDYNRGMSYLVLLAFPIMAWLWNSSRRWLVILFVLAILYPAGLTESRASKLALILGLITTTSAFFFPILLRWILAVFPVLALGWPFAAQWSFSHTYDFVARFPNSWRARMEIWDYMSYRIVQHPWLGWGLGTSHTLAWQNPDSATYVFTTSAAGHPHNAVIELWVELGIPGLILGILFALYVLRRALNLDLRVMPFALGAWVAALCLSLVAYNFWTDSLWAAFALVGFAFSGLSRFGSGFFTTSFWNWRPRNEPHHAEQIAETFNSAAHKI